MKQQLDISTLPSARPSLPWRQVLVWTLLVALGATVATSLAVRAIAQTALIPVAVAAATAPPASEPMVTGEMMAHGCAACHGTLGRLGDESFMPLAGMPVRQFVTTMTDFREGRRPATLMSHVAQGFSDAEIRAMGDFFVAVPPQAAPSSKGGQ
jgi:cytochrome subunit of sulfide dehydrogenase